MQNIETVSIIGGGAWGRAVASLLACKVRTLQIIASDSKRRHQEMVSLLNRYSNITCTSKIDVVTVNSDVIVVATPAQELANVIEQVNTCINQCEPGYFVNRKMCFVITSKGIDCKRNLLMSQVIEQDLTDQIDYEVALLAGPNFAHEVFNSYLSLGDVATKDSEVGAALVKLFSSEAYIASYTSDIVGVQLCSALKNVYAIIFGIAVGCGIAKNTHSALIVRALGEMQHILSVMGGDISTVMSPSGIGDFILTVNNSESRNMRFGLAIAKGMDIQDELDKATVEGYYTTFSIYKMCLQKGIDMPIISFLYDILYNKKYSNIDGADLLSLVCGVI